MNKDRKLIIAGNWKMNKTVAEALDLVRGLKIDLANVKEVDMVVCPPFTALCEVSKSILDSNLRLGAQNMSEHNLGAYTGEIGAVMLKEFSVRYVILGHSERRQYQNESDSLIAKKALAAHRASLKPITVTYETRDGNALAGSDYVQTSGSLTLGPNATSISIPIIADSVHESIEAFTVVLTSVRGGKLDRAVAAVTIVDDDSPPGPRHRSAKH